MKISIALTVLILAAAAGLGWKNHAHLTKVSTSHAKLVTEAAGLGISLDLTKSVPSVRSTKRADRGDKVVEAKAIAADIIALFKEAEAMEKKGEPPDETMHKRMLEFMDRMMSLDIAQLKS
jgi:hypothetical protein